MAGVTSEEYEFTLANKSWAELYEEEHPDESDAGKPNDDKSDTKDVTSIPSKTDSPDEKKEDAINIICNSNENGNQSEEKEVVKESKDRIDDSIELCVDEESMMGIDSSPVKCMNTPPKNFISYANALKSVSPENKIDVSRPSNHVISSDSQNKKFVKREIQKDFLQDDLSLTSHLDVFHMQSPSKQNSESEPNKDTGSVSNAWNKTIEGNFPKINEWPLPRSAKKQSDSSVKQNVNDHTEVRSGKRRLPLMQVIVPLMQIDTGLPHKLKRPDQIPDEVLMPSPSKIIRSFGNNTENSKSPRNLFVESRKRQREIYSSPLNKSKNEFSSPSNKHRNTFSSPSNRIHDDHETDPAILTRRQKQIDFGKNTVGYERYISEVPRDKREKKHPKTPPRHLKYSRRAWDGLIKNWRKRLHYWDPSSEGGGNPELLEDLNESEYSEFSGNEGCSLPNSLPSTPQQDWKRRKAKYSEQSVDEDYNDYYINDYEGCKPLDDI